MSTAIQVADILVEIEQVLGAVGMPGCVGQLRAQWRRFLAAARTLAEFNAGLPEFADWLAALPRRRDPSTCPKVVVTGDFFTRFSPFFMEGVHELYAGSGIILKPVDLGDLVQYAAYHDVAGAASGWGMKPGYPALAKACLRVFQPDGQQYLRQWINYQAERRLEGRYRKIFRKTGLLVAGTNNVSSLFEKAIRAHFTGDFWRGHPQRRQRAGGGQGRLRRDFPHRPVQLPALPHLRGHPQTAEPAGRHAAVDLRERRLRGVRLRFSGRWKSTSNKFWIGPPNAALKVFPPAADVLRRSFVPMNSAKPSIDYQAALEENIRQQRRVVLNPAKRYLDGVTSLPPAPMLVTELLTLFREPDRDVDQVVQLISYEPSLTAQILRLCNSASFAGQRAPDDIFEAVSRVGFSRFTAWSRPSLAPGPNPWREWTRV